jgi:iron(III) transport system ATP-binding protein
MMVGVQPTQHQPGVGPSVPSATHGVGDAGPRDRGEDCVVVEDLVVSYGGEPVVRGASIAFARGSITAVLGPSGCGKTTLLRAIAGFLRPDGGTITVAGRVVAGPRVFVAPEQRRVGIVAQEGALFPTRTAAGNVAFGLRGRAAAERDRIVGEWLRRVGLAGFDHARPSELSGGQQQRVALARALAPEPSVVLLDEPFSSLDALLRERLREDVVAVLRDAATTAVLVTHDRDEAFATADRIAVMLDGRVVQIGTPSEVYHAPTSRAVAELVGEVCELVGGENGEVVTVRPEQLVLLGFGAEGTAGERAGSRGPFSAGTAETVSVRSLGGRDRVTLRQVRAGEGRIVHTYVAPGAAPSVGALVSVSIAGSPLSDRFDVVGASTQRSHGDG